MLDHFRALVIGIACSIAVLALDARAGAQPSPSPAEADADPDGPGTQQREEARRVAARAYERYEAHDHGAALALFRTAHRLYPNARLLLGIGNCLAELQRPVEAIDALEAALEHPVAPLDARLRRETTTMLDELRPQVGLLEMIVEPPGALVLIDSEPVDARVRRTAESISFRTRIRAGVHRVEARAAGHLPVRRDVTIEGGTAITEVTLRLPRDPVSETRGRVETPSDGERDSGGTSPWPWIGVGAGAVLTATVIVLIAISVSSGTPDGDPGSLGYVVEVLRHDR